MPASARQTAERALSVFFAFLPVGFALVRAVSTRSDYRYVWVALATYVGAILAKNIHRGPGPTTMLALGFARSFLFGALAAWFTGARNLVSLVVVVGAFAFCWTAHFALRTFGTAPEFAPSEEPQTPSSHGGA